jgi:hypothetical protein
MRYVMRYLPLFALACLAACGESLGLQATFANRVDTVSVYALTGTPVATPSGYSMALGQVVRTDGGVPFDFVFDIDTAGRPKLLPTGALHLGQGSGIQITPVAFDSIRIAPTSRYQLDSAVVVAINSVAIAQSRPVTCPNGLPGLYYAKLHVLDIDTTSTSPTFRRLQMEILDNQNCGFRGLEIGVPRS